MSHKTVWAFAITSVAAFMVTLDNLVVTTAIPVIRRDLNAGIGGLEWTVNAYTLTFAVLLLTGAALGDRFGRRRLLAIGLAIFTVSSAAAALAPTIGALDAARALQGLGGAIVMPLTLTILASSVPAERRGLALGAWGGISGLAVAFGPLVGGAVVDGFSWHWVFWLNVPIGIVLVPLVLLRLEESRGPWGRVDLPGLALVSSGLLGIVWALVRANTIGWASPEIVAAGLAGVVLVVAFVLWELRAPAPMLPMRFFRNRTFALANTASLFFSFGMFGSIFLLAQFFQTVQHFSPLSSGLRILPWTAMPMIIAPIAGAFSDRIGGQRLMGAGLALQALGLAWIAAVSTPTTPYIELVAPFTIAGAGMALFFAPVANVVLSSVRPAEQGQASGANNAIRELGGVLGVAVLASIFAGRGGYGSGQAFTDGMVPAVFDRRRGRPGRLRGGVRDRPPAPRDGAGGFGALARARRLSSPCRRAGSRECMGGGSRRETPAPARARRRPGAARPARGSPIAGHLDGGLRPRSRRTRVRARRPPLHRLDRRRAGDRAACGGARAARADRARHDAAGAGRGPGGGEARPAAPRLARRPRPPPPSRSGSARRSPPPGCPSRAGSSCPRTRLSRRSSRRSSSRRPTGPVRAVRGSSAAPASSRRPSPRLRAAGRGGAVLVEEHVDGPAVTVSGFSAAGTFVPLAASDRVTADGAAFGVPLAQIWPSPHAEAAIEVARRAVAALGIEDGPSSTQLRISRGGPEVIEVAARLGGSHEAELVGLVTGLDLNGLALAAAFGEPLAATELAVHRGAPGGAVTRFLVAPPGTLESVELPQGLSGIVAARVYHQPGHRVGPFRRASDRAGDLLAAGASREEAVARAEAAVERIRFVMADAEALV